MIYFKTDEEIELLRTSNLLVSRTHAEIASMMQSGVKTINLDKRAEEFIRDNKAEPGFLGYNKFPNTLCISVNSEVVHGIPSNYELRDGDIVSVDCGVKLNGFFGDSAYTFSIGEISEEKKQLLEITKKSLFKAIEIAVHGKRVGDIGFTIQKYVEKNGYSVVRELTGHGIGRNLHEEPEVPNYGRAGRGKLLKKGMVIAIEPMINLGRKNVVIKKDGWTVQTSDGKPSAHFEHTIAIKKGKADILSNFNYIEKVLNKK
ncbi:MAG: type I methionyl aminopeptidase [Bacteroidetes bacterium 4572_128]|nr:MAG: type I methionyl aminopeptidase [Bacteroidetes bacterium 4572_128]